MRNNEKYLVLVLFIFISCGRKSQDSIYNNPFYDVLNIPMVEFPINSGFCSVLDYIIEQENKCGYEYVNNKIYFDVVVQNTNIAPYKDFEIWISGLNKNYYNGTNSSGFFVYKSFLFLVEDRDKMFFKYTDKKYTIVHRKTLVEMLDDRGSFYRCKIKDGKFEMSIVKSSRCD